MFRSSTIIREIAQNLAEVIFTLKHSVKSRRYLLCGCVAACHGMACVLYAVHSAQHTTTILEGVFRNLETSNSCRPQTIKRRAPHNRDSP